MATWYVNSAAGGTAAGTSWANACLTIAAAIALSAAGDDFDVLSTHAETSASTITLTFKGTPAAPNRVFSCDNTNSPAQAGDLLAGASVATTGSAANLNVNGYAYIYGVAFSVGSGANTGSIYIGPSAAFEQAFDTCAFKFLSTTNAFLEIGNTSANVGQNAIFTGTTVNFANLASGLVMIGGQLTWKNTAAAIAGTAPTDLLLASAAGHLAIVMFDGVDLSGVPSGKTIVAAMNAPANIQLANCELATGVTVCATPLAPGVNVDLVNSDSAATGNRQERYRYQGALTRESTVVKTGGASDDVAALSWKVVTSANAKVQSPFDCFEIAVWSDTAGVSHTVSIDVITDNVVLNTNDVWVEAQYLGSSSYPLASMASSGVATQLTAGSALAASTSTWTTTGLGTPKPQKLSVTFTAQTKGYVRLFVRVAKASTTMWIDPYPTVI